MPTVLQCGDVHLGHRQYGLAQRFEDGGAAWLHLCEVALHSRVDGVLVAGDLFDRPTLNPETLRQAEQGLLRLANAEIPVLVIAGNHDMPRLRERSWLDHLAEAHLIILLGDPLAGTWGEWVAPTGTWSIVGVPYLGARLSKVLTELHEVAHQNLLTPTPNRLLMLHTDFKDDIGAATLSTSDLAPFRPYFAYAAVGHVHTKYFRQGWVGSTGSLIEQTVTEAGSPLGYTLVTLPENEGEEVGWSFRDTPRRPYHVWAIQVGSLTEPKAILDVVDSYVQESNPASGAMLEVVLRGESAWPKEETPVQALRARLERLQPLHYRVSDMTTRPASSGWLAMLPDAGGTLETLKDKVVQYLIEDDPECPVAGARMVGWLQGARRALAAGLTLDLDEFDEGDIGDA